MAKFLLKRLFLCIFVLIGISILIFFLSHVIPGDPARLALGERATQEAVEEYREAMHYNDPLYKQYFYWVKDVFHGDFGLSINTKREVNLDVAEFLPASLELVLVTTVIAVIMSFTLGLISSRYKDTWIDGVIRFMSYIAISVPTFVWAVIFMMVFGYIWTVLPVFNRITTGLLPPDHITGMYVLDYLLAGNLAGAWDAFKHLLLPALALSMGSIFQDARILRSSCIDNMNKEFISVVTGFGIPRRRIINRYLLKPSSISVVTVVGLDIASTLGNAFLVETIFNWPGISRYCLSAMLGKDLNAITTVVLIIGVMYMISNIIVDVIVAALDPRVRLGE